MNHQPEHDEKSHWRHSLLITTFEGMTTKELCEVRPTSMLFLPCALQRSSGLPAHHMNAVLQIDTPVEISLWPD
jgi:hypothetical protein